MKHLLIITLLYLPLSMHSQTKKELYEIIGRLQRENKELTAKNESLRNDLDQATLQLSTYKVQLDRLSREIEQLKTVKQTAVQPVTGTSTTTSGTRCKATTAKGTQCSRTASAGSDYCWQHQETYEPTKERPSPSSTTGRTIYTGPRGGRYYINSSGKKVYVK